MTKHQQIILDYQLDLTNLKKLKNDFNQMENLYFENLELIKQMKQLLISVINLFIYFIFRL